MNDENVVDVEFCGVDFKSGGAAMCPACRSVKAITREHDDGCPVGILRGRLDVAMAALSAAAAAGFVKGADKADGAVLADFSALLGYACPGAGVSVFHASGCSVSRYDPSPCPGERCVIARALARLPARGAACG